MNKFALALLLATLLLAAPAVHAGDATAGPWTSCEDRALGNVQSTPDGFFMCTSTGSTQEWAPQTIVIGETPTTCDANNKGRLRWDATESTIKMCDGSDWKKIVASGGSDAAVPPEGMGYFVLTSASWTGDLGNVEGADDKCLSDLTANTWLNKSDAVSRGLLNADHVRAFLCGSDQCAMALPYGTYTFARSGSATAGGATFIVDGWGSGPGDSDDWSNATHFDSTATYWSGRFNYGSPEEFWVDSHQWNNGFDNCSNWTDEEFYSGIYGDTAQTNHLRWTSLDGGEMVGCDNTKRLVCFVHTDE
ncbi:MAG: hypothetical protein WDO70_12220 [Alphaproteobacteria bacterium]